MIAMNKNFLAQNHNLMIVLMIGLLLMMVYVTMMLAMLIRLLLIMVYVTMMMMM